MCAILSLEDRYCLSELVNSADNEHFVVAQRCVYRNDSFSVYFAERVTSPSNGTFIHRYANGFLKYMQF